MSFLIPMAYADTAAAAPPGNEFMQFALLGGFLVVFYFMIWRPLAKGAKEHKTLVISVQKGDEVGTTGGVVGRITKVTDEFIVMEVSDTVSLNIQRQAVVAALPKGTLKAI